MDHVGSLSRASTSTFPLSCNVALVEDKCRVCNGNRLLSSISLAAILMSQGIIGSDIETLEHGAGDGQCFN
jgi:hypothetical protein